MLRLSLVGALLGVASAAWAGPVPLTGEALRQELVGSVLEIDTPLTGVVIPVRAEYRLALARYGYALVRCELAVFKPEA